MSGSEPGNSPQGANGITPYGYLYTNGSKSGVGGRSDSLGSREARRPRVLLSATRQCHGLDAISEDTTSQGGRQKVEATKSLACDPSIHWRGCFNDQTWPGWKLKGLCIISPTLRGQWAIRKETIVRTGKTRSCVSCVCTLESSCKWNLWAPCT